MARPRIFFPHPILALLLSATLVVVGRASARADGGTLRWIAPVGSFTISVFSAPEPLLAGMADLSVLVQARPSGEAVLDAHVALRLRGPGASTPITLPATHEQATNKLLYAAPVHLDTPGTWRLDVDVQRGAERATTGGDLPVEGPPSGLAAIWPLLLLPLAVALLFALHQWISRTHGGGASSA